MNGVFRPIAAWAAALLLVTSCGSDGGDGGTATSAPAEGVKVPVVVDTDMALDDILALLYVASSPEVDLLAVTVTGTGEVICPVGAQRARALLAAIDVTDVPVACGDRSPLSGDREFPLTWRTLASRAYDLELPEVAAPAGTPDAVVLLTETINNSAHPVILLTLGPLTDVAQALRSDPTIADHLARIVMMGGAVAVDGNVVPEGSDTAIPVEWNLYIDPEADAAVFASGVPITLVGLDATNGVPMTEDVKYLLNGNVGTSAIALADAALESHVPPYLWDPLAAITAIEPTLVSSHEATIAIDVDGDDAGRTFADPAGNAVLVADPPVDPSAVIEHWVRVLAGLGPDEPLGEPKRPPLVGYVNVGFDGTTCTATAPSDLPVGTVLVTVDDPSGLGFAAIVAHIVEGVTWEEAIAYALAHPGEQPPMIDDFEIVAATPIDGTLTSPAPVELQPGLYGVVCTTIDGAFYQGTTFTVTG